MAQGRVRRIPTTYGTCGCCGWRKVILFGRELVDAGWRYDGKVWYCRECWADAHPENPRRAADDALNNGAGRRGHYWNRCSHGLVCRQCGGTMASDPITLEAQNVFNGLCPGPAQETTTERTAERIDE